MLVVRGLTKRFPGVLANDRIDFELRPAEIHALLGENGAGKSTFMNVLYGLVEADAGEMTLRGGPFVPRSPADAIDAGIGMVHQHFMLVPTLTVAENIILGAEPVSNGPTLDLAGAAAQVRRLGDAHGLHAPPHALVRDLPVGVQQRVEILKALYRQADILILDEPTAMLAPPEVEQLFLIMRSLAAEGRSIIFITHKLREVLEVADRITVLRGGRVVGTVVPGETDEAALAALMVGRSVLLRVEKRPSSPGEPVLEVDGLVVRDNRRAPAVDGLDLIVRSGEIVGLAGVEGNGQAELVEALTGLRTVESGRVRLRGQDVTNAGSRVLAAAGLSHVPEDRYKHGLVLAHSLADNLVLSRYQESPFSRGLRIVRDAIKRFAQRLTNDFDIRAASVDVPAATLSGGNQQKAVVARELSRPLELLVAAQPTRGVDVGSTEFIHRKIVEARDAGAGVLLVSAELDEVIGLADRIGVLYRGRIVETIDAARADRARLGLLIGGGALPG